MKGVILSMNPRARIVDITHNVLPQNVEEAAYLLWACYRYFPQGTVFTCVVDPGVGTERKIVCVGTDQYRLIAPDNGLLNLIAHQETIRESIAVVDPHRFGLQPISATFHGRDIFAPLAAQVSLGKPLTKFGKHYDLTIPSAAFYEPERGATNGRILHIDHFGNIVTNIPEKYFGRCTIKVGKIVISTRIASYSEAPEGLPCMMIGSSRLIEVAVRNDSAAKVLNANRTTPLSILKTSEH